MNEPVRYCYAVARHLPEGVLGEVRGVGGAPVELISSGDLLAITSPVDGDEFSAQTLRERLEDFEWLGEVARAHNTVVDFVAQHGVTLPLRLATIYLDEDRVREVLDSENGRWKSALDRLDGRVEWGVKVFAPEQPPVAGEDTPRAQTGRSYLRKRLEQRDTRESAVQAAAQSADEIEKVLAGLAHAHSRHRLQAQELSGIAGANVLNASYLVDAEQQETFLARVDELRQHHAHCRVEATGPWAPYSFALEQASG